MEGMHWLGDKITGPDSMPHRHINSGFPPAFAFFAVTPSRNSGLACEAERSMAETEVGFICQTSRCVPCVERVCLLIIASRLAAVAAHCWCALMTDAQREIRAMQAEIAHMKQKERR